jgi:glycosyltransferase involved in cell wall biosynthesis
MTDLSVAFACGREGFDEVEAGDTIQMRKTRSALEARGVSVRFVDDPAAVAANANCDLLHVFNLPYSDRALRFIRAGKRQGLAVALSPVYWTFAHSHVVRFLHNRFGIEPRPALKPFVPALFRGYVLGRRVFRRGSNFDLRPAKLREAVSEADLLLPNSEAELRHLARWVGNDRAALAHKSRVVYNAVDTDLFEPVEDAASTVADEFGVSDFVLQVGAMFPNKNQLSLLRATEALDVPLVLVGRGSSPYGDRVREAAGDRSDVVLVDEQPHESLPVLYSAARVHTLPSFRESPGLVSLEAALCGCELVVSNESHCPVQEYFDGHAHRCDPYATSSIRQAVKSAISTRQNSDEFRADLRSRCTWEQTADDTLDGYRSVV